MGTHAGGVFAGCQCPSKRQVYFCGCCCWIAFESTSRNPSRHSTVQLVPAGCFVHFFSTLRSSIFNDHSLHGSAVIIKGLSMHTSKRKLTRQSHLKSTFVFVWLRVDYRHFDRRVRIYFDYRLGWFKRNFGDVRHVLNHQRHAAFVELNNLFGLVLSRPNRIRLGTFENRWLNVCNKNLILVDKKTPASPGIRIRTTQSAKLPVSSKAV